MDLLYKSTRNSEEVVTASQAILKGLADNGGLFVPTSLPKFDVSLAELAKMNYQEVAYEVMKLLLTDFTEEELKHCINSAYDSKFELQGHNLVAKLLCGICNWFFHIMSDIAGSTQSRGYGK